MQQDFDVAVLPVEAFLLVTDVLDRGAHRRLVTSQTMGETGIQALEHTLGIIARLRVTRRDHDLATAGRTEAHIELFLDQDQEAVTGTNHGAQTFDIVEMQAFGDFTARLGGSGFRGGCLGRLHATSRSAPTSWPDRELRDASSIRTMPIRPIRSAGPSTCTDCR